MNRQYLTNGAPKKSEGLEVQSRILRILVLRDCCIVWVSSAVVCLGRNRHYWLHRLLVCQLLEVRHVKLLDSIVWFLEVNKHLFGSAATLVSLEARQLLLAMVNQLVNLEEQIGFISKQLSSNVLILICIKYVGIVHNCNDALYQVLEPFIDQRVHSWVELYWPFFLGKVIQEILLHLLSNKLLCFQDSLVDGVEESQEHVDVEGCVEELVCVFLGVGGDEQTRLKRLLVYVIYLNLLELCPLLLVQHGFLCLYSIWTYLSFWLFKRWLHCSRRIVNGEHLLHMF